MKVIHILSELIQELSKSSKEQYAEIGARLDISLDQFTPFIHWNKNHYTRNCIIRTDHYELILLCWEPGQKTPIHCHGGEECWVYVIDGHLNELHYELNEKNLNLTSEDKMSSGEKSFMCDELGFHKLENIGDNRAISLHLYMDPIDSCSRYDEAKHAFQPVDLTYYSYEGALTSVSV